MTDASVLADFRDAPAASRVVYVLAASHSGSTLLALLLGAHPEVCTVGELKATVLGDANTYRCSCGTPIRACAFWQDVARTLARRGLAFDPTAAGADFRVGASRYARWLLRPLHRGPLLERLRDAALGLDPTWRRRLRSNQRLNAELARYICERTRKRLIVDSSKIGLRLKYLLRNPALDVRVIWLIRDGRGVTLTYRDPARFADSQDPTLRGGGSGGSRWFKRRSMLEAAREWRRSNDEAAEIVNRLERWRWTAVRYEDLCTSPASTLARLFAFMEVDPERIILDFRSVECHVIGNGMRLDSNRQIRLDERWRSELTGEELQLFHAVAGEMNRRFGYA